MADAIRNRMEARRTITITGSMLFLLSAPFFLIFFDFLRSLILKFPFASLAFPVESALLLFILVLIVGFFMIRFLGLHFFHLDILSAWGVLFILFLYWLIHPARSFWMRTILPGLLLLLLGSISVFLSQRGHPSLFHHVLYLLLVLFCYLSFLLQGPLWSIALLLLLPMSLYLLSTRGILIVGLFFSFVLVAVFFLSLFVSDKVRITYQNMPDRHGPLSSLEHKRPQRRSNIILIVIDTARKDSFLLEKKNNITPHLKRFSEEGIVIKKFVANSPWTPPSHASLFTGLFPSEHGVFHNTKSGPGESPVTILASEQKTLAEILSDHGIQTAGFFANPSLTRMFGFAQGFDHYVFVRNNTMPISFKIVEMLFEKFKLFFPSLFGYRSIPLFNQNDVALSQDVLRAAKRWIQRYSSRGPFFLFINLMEQHYIRYFFDPLDGELRIGPKYYWESPERILLHPETMKERHRKLSEWHKRTIKNVDYHLGAFLDFLRESGIYENTTIVITSDHGNLFGEYDFYDHQLSIHDHLIFVPFLIKYSREFQDRRIDPDRIYQQVDFFSEALDLFGISIPPLVHGLPFDKDIQNMVITQLYRKPSLPDPLKEKADRDLCGTVLPIGDRYYQVIYATNGLHEVYLLDDHFAVISSNRYHALKEDISIQEYFGRCPGLLMRGEGKGVSIDEEMRKKLKALGYID